MFSQDNLSSPALLRWESFRGKYEGKIRKKFADPEKDPQPGEKLKDVLFELDIAYLLCKSERFSVEYERWGKKGPDFTVTDKTNVVFT